MYKTQFEATTYYRIQQFKEIKNKIRELGGLSEYINYHIEKNNSTSGITKLLNNPHLHLGIILNNCLSDELKKENLTIQEKIYCVANKIDKLNNFCVICGKKTKFFRISHGYNSYCSRACQNKNPKLRESVSKSVKKSWGKKTDKEKSENYEKSKATYLEKYGTENPRQLPEIKDKIRNKLFKNRYEEILKEFSNLNIIRNINYNSIKILEIFCDNCLKNYEINLPLLRYRYNKNIENCTICNPPSHYTKLHTDIVEIIKNNNVEYIECDRKILDGYEIDIYLPDYKLAIEVNGSYYHSDAFKIKDYHKNKKDLAESKSIDLIYIWEDYWLHYPEIIKSRLKSRLNLNKNIYARKCEVKEITAKENREFLKRTHLQGFVNGSVKLGLFYDNKLVSVMLFGKLRKPLNTEHKDNNYELLRFSSELDLNIIGGANKLFNYFIKNYNPKEVVSYASRDWSSGKLYENLGFDFIHKTEPGYYWINNNNRYHRFNCRKDKLVKEGYNPNKSETQIMYERGFLRIYDSGNLKYVWINK